MKLTVFFDPFFVVKKFWVLERPRKGVVVTLSFYPDFFEDLRLMAGSLLSENGG